jgi:hypothetical protein
VHSLQDAFAHPSYATDDRLLIVRSAVLSESYCTVLNYYSLHFFITG